MSEEREISLEEVAGNCLGLLDSMNPEDKGFDQATRANDMLLKHVEESNKIDNDYELASRKLELEEKKQELEREKFEHEKERAIIDDKARERDSKIQSTTNKIAAWTLGTTTLCTLAKIGFDIWGLNKVGNFETTGVWRSTASKLMTGKIGKK